MTLAIWVASLIAARLAKAEIVREGLPDVEDFGRREDGAMAVLGDYVYLEGGFVWIRVELDDGSTDYNRTLANTTVSISLAESWTNETVTFHESSRGDKLWTEDLPPLWPYEEENTLYQWGGRYPEIELGMDQRLWYFTADEEGGGEWQPEGDSYTDSPETSDSQTRLYRGANHAYTVCGHTAYSIGGSANFQTERLVDGDDIMLPGMVSLNMKERTWKNESLLAMATHGHWEEGQAVCAENLTDRPLIFTFGGRTSTEDGLNITGTSMSNITVYDTIEERWHWQTTTGITPTQRWQFCAVGVQSERNTYEIFIYGGWNIGLEDDLKILDDIWVLTIPGFYWMRVDVEADPRWMQNCAIVGKGRRQMLVNGGLASFARGGIGNTGPDPWTWGLGIFDLTDLAWSSSYDANAETYKAPRGVRGWYEAGGLDDIEWSSDSVRDLFAAADDDSKTPPSSSSSSSPPSNDSDSPPIGAIVGGVLGAVAVLALVALLVFCFRRRKKQKQSARSDTTDPQSQHFMKPELDATWTHSQVISPNQSPPVELYSDSRPMEIADCMGPHGVSELPATGHYDECAAEKSNAHSPQPIKRKQVGGL